MHALKPITRIPFGSLPDGRLVQAYTLTNRAGSSLRVIDYGGIVTSLRIPDREGNLDDVVLGFDSLAPYLAEHPYFGAIAGRVAGRITGGRITMDGENVQLALNDGRNHLHGGFHGLDKRLWDAAALDGSLRLTYHSPNGEEGYPGAVDFAVTYTLTENDGFILETEAISDQATPVSPTQHSYFNLAGEHSGPVVDHEIQIQADQHAAVGPDMTLLGGKFPVAGTGEDFRQARRLGDALASMHNSHGALYFLHPADGLRMAARIVEPRHGRVLIVHTTEDCLQFYTGSGLDGSLVGKSGKPYQKHAGLCLECQGYPGASILRPGTQVRHTTLYQFSTI